MKRVDYDERQHDVYAKGRAISPERVARILAVLAEHLPAQRPLAIADVGSGVGRFTPALADTFGGPVYGIEPARRMRDQAEQVAAHPQVRYLPGRAETSPLPENSCDAAFCWFVWHHVEDKAAAARELARVVRPAGTLLLRINAADRMPAMWWFEHFPRVPVIEAALSGTVEQVMAPLTAAGWQLQAVATVVMDSTLGRDLQTLQLRAISTLEHLTEAEVAAGLAAAEKAVAGREDEPVAAPGDLFVLRNG